MLQENPNTYFAWILALRCNPELKLVERKVRISDTLAIHNKTIDRKY